MKKFIAALSAVFIAVTLSLVAVAAPASAHSASLQGAATCNADGSATIKWTLTNQYSLTADVSVTSDASVIPLNSPLAKSGQTGATQTYNESVASPAANFKKTMNVTVQWSDNITESYSYSVTVPSSCAPQDASASVNVAPATCDADGVITEGNIVNATWDSHGIKITGHTYTVYAYANNGHLFSNGTDTLKLTGSVPQQLSGSTCDNTNTKVRICHATASNSNPYTNNNVSYNSIITGGHGVNGINDGDIIPPFDYIVDGVTHHYPGQNWDTSGQATYNNNCTPPPPPTCLPASAVSYTYSADDSNSGVITVTDSANSTHVLCQPFWVHATSWKFTNNNSSWPQTLDVSQATFEVSGVGTYDYAAQVTCGQGDIYASFNQNDVTLSPTPYLYGPSNPFAEHFLADMGFSGPSPTWIVDNYNCFVPQVTGGTPTVDHLSCAAGSANTISLPDVPGGVWEITDGTQDVKYTIGTGTGATPFTPADNDTYTITLVDGSSSDGYAVTPYSGTYTPVAADSLDCNTQVTPVTPTVTKIRTCDATGSVSLTPAAGIDYYVNGVQITEGTDVVDGQTNPVTGLSGKVTVTAVAESGYEFTADATSSWKFWLGKESTCSFSDVSFGTCVAGDNGSTESVSMIFHNPGKHSAFFEVTGPNGLDFQITVPGHTTTVETVVDSTASAGDVLMVYINHSQSGTEVDVPQFEGCQVATPGDPTSHQATCNQDNQTVNDDASITVDLEPGLIYEVTGPNGYDQANLTPATNNGNNGDYSLTGLEAGQYVVSVTAAPGYVLGNTTSTWPFDITLNKPICDLAVSVTPADCSTEVPASVHTADSDQPTITVQLDPDVVYTAEPQPSGTAIVLTDATTVVPPGSYLVVVTLSAQGQTDNAQLPGGVDSITYGVGGAGSDVPFDLTNFCPPTEASWNAGASGTNAVCTSGSTTDGVITLVHSAGQEGKVTYTITNAANKVIYTGNTDNTVSVPAGSYTVKATPPAGDGISGNTQDNGDGSEVFPTIVIGTTSTDCDGTLAFTGGTIAWMGFVLAGGMLFLGIALLYMRRRGNRTAE